MANSNYYDYLYKTLDHDWIDAPMNMVLYQEDVEEAVKSYGSRPKTAVDLGCGYGAHAFSFALGDTKLDAIDLNPQAIELANELFDHRNIEYICGDYYEYEFNKTYDFVYSFRGFGDGEDADQVKLLKLVNSLMKDDGRAYIWVYNKPYWKDELYESDEYSYEYSYDHESDSIIKRLEAENGEVYERRIRVYTLDDFKKMADSAGLEIDEVTLSSSLDHINMVYLGDKTIDEAKYFYALLKKK